MKEGSGIEASIKPSYLLLSTLTGYVTDYAGSPGEILSLIESPSYSCPV